MIEWKNITGFKNVVDNIYMISNNGDVLNKKTNKFLHQKIANKKHHPYYAVSLLHKDGKVSWVLVHQLVVTFFVQIPKDLLGMEDLVPDHLDNNGLNNNFKNLEWKTRGMNVSDAFKKGYIDNSGENHRGVFITTEQAHKICECLEKGFSYDKILKEMEFEDTKKYRSLLIRIKNGYGWKKVSSLYNINKNEIHYNKSQQDTLKKLPYIVSLIEQGKTNSEIFNLVYNNKKYRRDTKMRIIQAIRKKEIFKEYL